MTGRSRRQKETEVWLRQRLTTPSIQGMGSWEYWGSGGQESKPIAREGQSRSGTLVSDHSSCSPILVPPEKYLQYLLEPYLAHYVITKAKEKC